MAEVDVCSWRILGLLQPCSFRTTKKKNMEKDQFAARHHHNLSWLTSDERLWSSFMPVLMLCRWHLIPTTEMQVASRSSHQWRICKRYIRSDVGKGPPRETVESFLCPGLLEACCLSMIWYGTVVWNVCFFEWMQCRHCFLAKLNVVRGLGATNRVSWQVWRRRTWDHFWGVH